jgi:hypothetical protein
VPAQLQFKGRPGSTNLDRAKQFFSVGNSLKKLISL